MKFVVDAQLPRKLCTLLNDLGANALHTLDLPEKNKTADDGIIHIASVENRIVITKDNDFLQSHMLRKQPAKLLMVNTGNISNLSLLHLFTANYALITSLFQSNNYIEITREEIIVHS